MRVNLLTIKFQLINIPGLSTFLLLAAGDINVEVPFVVDIDGGVIT